MSQVVRIEVRLPDGHWAGEATRESPSSTLQIIETMPLGKGRGTAQISTDELLLNQLEHLSGVESVNLLDDNKATVTIASGGGGFIKALRVVGVVPRTPFEVIDGWADWTIQCSPSQAKQLIEEKRDYRCVRWGRRHACFLFWNHHQSQYFCLLE